MAKVRKNVKYQRIIMNHARESGHLCLLGRWSSKFPGIEDTEAGIVCTVCKMRTGEQGNILSTNSSFVEGCKSYRIDTIRSHWESPIHASNLAAQTVAYESSMDIP